MRHSRMAETATMDLHWKSKTAAFMTWPVLSAFGQKQPVTTDEEQPKAHTSWPQPLIYSGGFPGRLCTLDNDTLKSPGKYHIAKDSKQTVSGYKP